MFPWYHGRKSRADAEQSLSSTPHDCFLIRESESEPDAFSISLKHEAMLKHFLISRPDGQYEVVGTEDRFPSLSSLVAYYSEHPLSVGGEKLTRACHMTPDTFTLPLQGTCTCSSGVLWDVRFGPSQLSCLVSSVGRALCLEYRVSWVRVPPVFSRKSDCLGCAVLLCLVCLFDLACFFLSSFSSLI